MRNWSVYTTAQKSSVHFEMGTLDLDSENLGTFEVYHEGFGVFSKFFPSIF